jgi:hypothetical protein
MLILSPQSLVSLLLLLLAVLPVLLPLVVRSYGIGRIGWLSLTGFLPTRIKSRNIMGFANQYRSELLLQTA